MEELDEMLKVYRYDGLAAGIRCDAEWVKKLLLMGTPIFIMVIYF